MKNSVDHDLPASNEADRSWSTLFSKEELKIFGIVIHWLDDYVFIRLL